MGRNLKSILMRLSVTEDGATAIEYSLIAAGISIGITVAVFAFGDTLNTMFFDQLPGMFD